MKITSLTTTIYKQPQLSYYDNKKTFSPTFKGDEFLRADNFIRNIEPTSFHRLKKVEFKTPLTIAQALSCIANSNNTTIKDALLYNLHSKDGIEDMAIEANSDNFIRNIKVKRLIGMGSYALVFETTDGNALKMVGMEHFPYKRKPTFFDIPIIKKGSLGHSKYYIEEKAQMNVTKDEAFNLINKIKECGYKINDCFYNSDTKTFKEEVFDKELVKLDQFGRSKNGKVYLIDPGCAIEPLKIEKVAKNFSTWIKKIVKL